MPSYGAVLLILIFANVPGLRAEEALKRASFIPQWSPQAQFAGYYVAYEKGFYKKHGIDLTILQGGPDRPSSQFLTKGKADFATLWLSTAIRMRASGQGIINIGQMIQRSALMLVAKKSSNIVKTRGYEWEEGGSLG